MIVDAQQLADIYGVTKNNVYLWIKEGCPVQALGEKGKSKYEFNTRDVFKWREKRAIKMATLSNDQITKEEAQRRKLSAEAALSELELAKKKGEVAEIEEVERTMSSQFAEVRSSLRKVPERCVIRLLGETDEARVKEVILSEIDSALELLANG